MYFPVYQISLVPFLAVFFAAFLLGLMGQRGSISVVFIFTRSFTSAAGSGYSGVDRTVPLLTLKSFNRSADPEGTHA